MKTITFNPDEWVLVPRVPTAEMRAAIMSGIRHDHMVRNYQEMLAAAPEHPAAEVGEPDGELFRHLEKYNLLSGWTREAIIRDIAIHNALCLDETEDRATAFTATPEPAGAGAVVAWMATHPKEPAVQPKFFQHHNCYAPQPPNHLTGGWYDVEWTPLGRITAPAPTSPDLAAECERLRELAREALKFENRQMVPANPEPAPATPQRVPGIRDGRRRIYIETSIPMNADLCNLSLKIQDDAFCEVLHPYSIHDAAEVRILTAPAPQQAPERPWAAVLPDELQPAFSGEQKALCETCKGQGMIGGPSYREPDEGGVPCPDCSPQPAHLYRSDPDHGE
jgi:hypothetical protein